MHLNACGGKTINKPMRMSNRWYDMYIMKLLNSLFNSIVVVHGVHGGIPSQMLSREILWQTTLSFVNIHDTICVLDHYTILKKKLQFF